MPDTRTTSLWSGRRFVRNMLVIILITGGISFATQMFGSSWWQHVTYQSLLTEVTVVGERPGGDCGARRIGERWDISWVVDGRRMSGWYQSCGAEKYRPTIGKSFPVWAVEGKRAFDWPPQEFSIYVLIVGAILASFSTLLTGVRDIRVDRGRTGAKELDEI